jgi:hypothetical protein
MEYKNPVRITQEEYYVSATEPNQLMECKFEVFTAVNFKDAVFWDVKSCGSCKNRHYGGTYRLNLYGDKSDDGGDMFFQDVGSYKSYTA